MGEGPSFVNAPTQRACGEGHSFSVFTVQIDINLETAGITHLVGLDGIPIELCFVSQPAYRRIDMARIPVADAALQLQEHVFAAGGIFLSEYLDIDRGLPVHRLMISLEDRTFADVIVSPELDALGKRRQRLLVTLC